MNPSRPSLPQRRPRGSALLTAIIFTTVMTLLVASVLGWSINERRMNERTVYWNEARNAAEGLCEYGAAQITYMSTTFDVLPTMNPFLGTTTPTTNLPLQLPLIPGTTRLAFNPNWANGVTPDSNIDTAPLETFAGTTGTLVDQNGLELIAGPPVTVASNGNLDYIDPAVTENSSDPFVGLYVKRKDYTVLATATAVPKTNLLGAVASHVQEVVSVRAAPLFDFFIFYAINDLELYPGSNMSISGPVHSNNDIYVNATSSATLTFNGTVSASGNIFHDMENSTDGQSGLTDNDIFFLNIPPAGPPGTPYSMYQGGVWHDSTMGTDSGPTYGPDTPGTPGSALFQLLAPNLQAFLNYVKAPAHWPGTLLTKAMGVPVFNPTGFNQPLAAGTDFAGNQYLPDSPYVDSGDQVTVVNGIASPYIDHHVVNLAGTTAKGNVSYINDPPDSDFLINTTTGTYYSGRRGLELSKYANHANLYILVNVTASSPDTATITYFGPYNETNLGSTDGQHGPNGGVLMGTANYVIPSYKTIANVTPLVTGSKVEPPELVSWVPYVLSGGNVTQGLYDYREGNPATKTGGSPVDLVQIDLMALNQALTDVNIALLNNHAQPVTPPVDSVTGLPCAIINLNGPYTATPQDNIWGSGASGLTNNAKDNTGGMRNNSPTSGGWNGVIYVDVEGTPTVGTRIAVGLGNAQTSTKQAAVTNYPTISNDLCVANTTAHATTPAALTFPLAGGTLPAVTAGATSTPYPYLINLIPNDTAALTATAPAVYDSKVGIDSDSTTGAPPTGLTIATNVPVYLEGNFNADGHIDNTDPENLGIPAWPATGNSNLPDDETAYNSTTGAWTPNATTAEVPVSIVGDAITLLSPTYFGGTSPGVGSQPTSFVFPTGASGAPSNPITGAAANLNAVGSNAYVSKATPAPNADDSTASNDPETMEVACAVVAGIRPTDSVSASGGAHNLPRFLEKWNINSESLVIRGSLVNLYASKFAVGRYHGSDATYTPASYYEPPFRHWGYDDLFESGEFPPATPNAYSIRRLDFKDITGTAYNAARAAAYPGDTFVPAN